MSDVPSRNESNMFQVETPNNNEPETDDTYAYETIYVTKKIFIGQTHISIQIPTLK